MLSAAALVLAALGALPTPLPIDSARTRAIDAIARGEVRAHTTPGIALGVVEDGLLVYSRGFGFADGAHRVRVTPNTKFYAGGLSEQFTAAAVLLLAQDKKLDLKDRVTRYIPELTSARNVTIAELLAHTSGLADFSALSGVSHDFSRPVKFDDVLRALNRAPLFASPGSQYRRNAMDYALAGLVVQRISGEPLSLFLQTRVFEPLIMTSTFLAGDEGTTGAAQGFTRRYGAFARARTPNAAWLFGSGDIVTTVNDLAKWDIGMPLILNVDSVRAMWSSAIQPPGSDLYGMGWMVDARAGEPFAWLNGSVPGYHAMNALLPDEHVAVIVLCNADSFGTDTAVAPERVASRVLDVIAPAPAAHVTNDIVRRASEWLDRLARLDIDRTQLTPGFSQYLTDRVVIQADLRSEGPLESIVPVENFQQGSDTVYVFDVRFRRGSLRYRFELTTDGKINALALEP